MAKASNGGPTILMTADAVGGVWTYALSLCGALPQYRFVLAIMGPSPSPAQRDAARALPNVVLEESGFHLEWMAGAETDLVASRDWLSALARRYSAVLFHCNGYAPATSRVACPTLVVAHSDVLSWWAAVHREPVPPSWHSYRREVIAGLAAADAVVAPTRAVLDDFARHYGLGRRPARVIPNGIDLRRYAPRPTRQVVMAAGRLWDAAKNLALLDEIAAQLPWPVEIAGNTTHPESGSILLAAARPLGVLSPGEMAQRLGTAAIFAAPARYEPFGLGILEAAASGCALVLGDIASLRENWNGAAVFVPPDDRPGWRAAIAALIANEHRRENLAAAARQRAQSFSREAMARGYAALCDELLGGTERREVA
jgi:glycosyltransferase involved in cell wall biosynthesis